MCGPDDAAPQVSEDIAVDKAARCVSERRVPHPRAIHFACPRDRIICAHLAPAKELSSTRASTCASAGSAFEKLYHSSVCIHGVSSPEQADTQTLLAVMAEERKVHEEYIARAANGDQTGNACPVCSRNSS